MGCAIRYTFFQWKKFRESGQITEHTDREPLSKNNATPYRYITQLSLLKVSSAIVEENELGDFTDSVRKANVENTFLVFINHAFLI